MNNKITDKAELIPPLHCWDIVSTYLDEITNKGKRESELAVLEKYKKRYHWEIDLEKVLDASYEALVLTDSGISIQWVSDGFTGMTGYPKKEALGKSPKMLQGKNTTEASRQSVRKKLDGQEVFTEDIVNYRKTGEEYICKVEIHPIFNKDNELIHYLALEQEVG